MPLFAGGASRTLTCCGGTGQTLEPDLQRSPANALYIEAWTPKQYEGQQTFEAEEEFAPAMRGPGEVLHPDLKRSSPWYTGPPPTGAEKVFPELRRFIRYPDGKGQDAGGVESTSSKGDGGGKASSDANVQKSGAVYYGREFLVPRSPNEFGPDSLPLNPEPEGKIVYFGRDGAPLRDSEADSHGQMSSQSGRPSQPPVEQSDGSDHRNG